MEGRESVAPVATTMYFRLLDAPEAMAVSRILSLYEDGPVFEYPSDPGKVEIDPDELMIGRGLWISFEQERLFEMEAEIVMAVDLDDAEGTSKYRLRYTRIDDADRRILREFVRRKRPGDDDDATGVAARLLPRRPSGSGAAPPPKEDTA